MTRHTYTTIETTNLPSAYIETHAEKVYPLSLLEIGYRQAMSMCSRSQDPPAPKPPTLYPNSRW